MPTFMNIKDQPTGLCCSVLEQCATAVVVTDLEGRVRYSNQAFHRLTGYSPFELIGKKMSVLKSGATPPAVYRSLWQTITSGKIWRGEIYNRRNDGTLYWEAITITPITDETGKVTKYAATIEDISAKRKLEADREELLGHLRDAYDKIDGLHGLLPICSHCKSIRSSAGTWHTLENYLKEHSEAHLSHGICPECLHSHYPELEQKIKKRVG